MLYKLDHHTATSTDRPLTAVLVLYKTVLLGSKAGHLQEWVYLSCHSGIHVLQPLKRVDAELPELDKDVGTGNEGDIEARCFSESFSATLLVYTKQLWLAIWSDGCKPYTDML
jgi:hypothetical protein